MKAQLAIGVALLSTACNGFVGEVGLNSRGKVTPNIIGEWTSEAFESQLGTSTETFCFRSDGNVEVKSQTQAGLLENEGTYQLNGTQLTLYWPNTGSSASARIKLTRKEMVVTFDNGKTRRYRRTNDNC